MDIIDDDVTIINDIRKQTMTPKSGTRTEVLPNSTRKANVSSMIEYDSRYTALGKIKSINVSKKFNTSVVSQSLPDSDESDDSLVDCESEDIDSVMGDYLNNGTTDSDDVSSVETSAEQSLDSGDEVFDSESTDSDLDFCNLELPSSYIARLKKNKLKMKQDHLKFMPDGQRSVIEFIKVKLNELRSMKLDLKSVVSSIKYESKLFNNERNKNLLLSLESKVRTLGQYVLGKMQLGYGKDLVKVLEQKLWLLENNSNKRVSNETKNELIQTFMELFEVALDEIDLIVELIHTHRKEKQKVKSKPKWIQNQLKMDVKRPLSKNNNKSNSKLKTPSRFKFSKKNSPLCPIIFRSAKELSSWSSTPQSRKSPKSSASHLSSSLKNRLDFSGSSSTKASPSCGASKVHEADQSPRKKKTFKKRNERRSDKQSGQGANRKSTKWKKSPKRNAFNGNCKKL